MRTPPRPPRFRPPSAPRSAVGKRGGRAESTGQEAINALLVKEAAAGNDVVRLKGGDPGVFGRLNSEVRSPALAFAGPACNPAREPCPCGSPALAPPRPAQMAALAAAGANLGELVPGISSALAAPLLAGVSLTDAAAGRGPVAPGAFRGQSARLSAAEPRTLRRAAA